MIFNNNSTRSTKQPAMHDYIKTGYHPFITESRQQIEDLTEETTDAAPEESRAQDSIDRLLSNKKSILQTKLDVLTEQLRERIRLRNDSIERLDYDECRLGTLFSEISPDGTQYQIGDRRMAFLEARGFDIQKERREQDVETWRDIVMISKDFLAAWEGLQQANAKEALLKDEE